MPGDLAVRSWGPHATTGELGWRHVGIVASPGGKSYVHAKGTNYGVVLESDSSANWDKWGRLPEFKNGINDTTSSTETGLGSETASLFGSSGYSFLDKFNLNFVKNLQKKGSLSLLLGKVGASVGSAVGTSSSSLGAGAYIKDNSAFLGNTYHDLLVKYGNKHGIPPILLYGIMMAESSGNPYSGRDKTSSYKGLVS